MSKKDLPRWADLALLPAVCLLVALLVAGAVVALVGQNPAEVIAVLIQGAFGSARGLSYTLYYSTTFIFTGLAVAVAFHGGLFNIGGEGQAILGGLGAGLLRNRLLHSSQWSISIHRATIKPMRRCMPTLKKQQASRSTASKARKTHCLTASKTKARAARPMC